jgi:hypothetical protein|tara:strand:- start:18041 stop:18328 length:288 start_codon:yes stop_codon:yes gene_type:complete
MYSYVPKEIIECPAFFACLKALNGRLDDFGSHHSTYSLLMSWPVAERRAAMSSSIVPVIGQRCPHGGKDPETGRFITPGGDPGKRSKGLGNGRAE